MLLSEKKCWKVVNGEYLRPKEVEDHSEAEQLVLKDTDKRRIQREVDDWDEKNEVLQTCGRCQQSSLELTGWSRGVVESWSRGVVESWSRGVMKFGVVSEPRVIRAS